MSDTDLTPEAAEQLRTMGYNPEEYEAFHNITENWLNADKHWLESACKHIMQEALAAVGQMRMHAPTFLQNPEKHFESSPSGLINIVAYEGCQAMCQAALNGDARAAGQLAGLAVMLTEALADVLEKSKTQKEFSGAKSRISEVARYLPYWPVLFYSRADAEVDALYATFESIGLSQGCPINLIHRSGRGRRPSLMTPMNLLIWQTVAELNRLRSRADEFRKRQELAMRLEATASDTEFFQTVLAMSLLPGAKLAYVCEHVPTEDEASIVSKMLELENLSAENAIHWAEVAVFPSIWRSLPDAKGHPAFKDIWKRAGSEAEFLSHSKQEVQRAVCRLASPNS